MQHASHGAHFAPQATLNSRTADTTHTHVQATLIKPRPTRHQQPQQQQQQQHAMMTTSSTLMTITISTRCSSRNPTPAAAATATATASHDNPTARSRNKRRVRGLSSPLDSSHVTVAGVAGPTPTRALRSARQRESERDARNNTRRVTTRRRDAARM
ncbi:hypothetical protein PPROV_000913800 [Pycnococcus provasolii]|uniref:Uncharacterized protein n=1 Tax=Pycnococcus provasolii TaxID=41880 RepID=A0A830HZU2_9CHLO|nr:hypothetical protein PPROV_000913800 [Pycnococcus provasolii]